MQPVTRTVPARVGLVGNPSDGHGGAVVATVVPVLAATVSVRHGAPHPLPPIIAVALDALGAHLGRPLGPVTAEWSTTIPRSVGLAGSSALAVATIDAAAELIGHRLDRRVVAALALAAEVEGLGVVAGWQDRIAQSLGGTVLVDAATMSVVDGCVVPAARMLQLPVPVELVVAWQADQRSDSGDYHGALRAAGGQLSDAMAALGELARLAAEALEAGNVDGFAIALDQTWRVRQAAAPLRADHAALVEAVRATGVPATTPGSGGSVVAVVRSAPQRNDAIEAARAIGAGAISLQMQ